MIRFATMDNPKRKAFKSGDLRRLASSDEFQDAREPDLRIGDIVTINSGGPNMLVVDIDGLDVTVAWRNEGAVTENTWTRPCLHRVRGEW